MLARLSVRTRLITALLLVGVAITSGWSGMEPALAADAVAASGAYNQGVQAYRDGDYQTADALFGRLHQAHPEDSRVTYYMAMSEAQLGRFVQARSLYQEILTLDPRGEAAPLAKEGLQYLPADQASLDQPPRFRKAPHTAGVASTDASEASSALGASGGTPAGGQSTAMTNGMSPQDWMQWQMMMSQMGGNNNNNNGGGMMPWMMMPQPGADGKSKLDPSVMSSYLMNQMMQNFSLGGTNPDENR